MDTELAISVISFVISVAITAIVYGLGPILLLAFHTNPISPKKLKWFHIVYTVVISFTLNVLSSMLGYGCNFMPALIWGYIFYNINKSQFQKRNVAIPRSKYTEQESQIRQFIVDESTGEVLEEKPVQTPPHQNIDE